jgi:hypothetical protein
MDNHEPYFFLFVKVHKVKPDDRLLADPCIAETITGLFGFVGGCLFCLWHKGNLFIALGNKKTGSTLVNFQAALE